MANFKPISRSGIGLGFLTNILICFFVTVFFVLSTQGPAKASDGNYDCVFNWAESNFPGLFSPAGTQSITAAPYYGRVYSQTNAILAFESSSSHLYYLGPVTGNTVFDLGPMTNWLTASGCSEDSYAWVLVSILDFENADRWAHADEHESYAVDYTYSRGSYSASDTYEGPDYYHQGLSGTLGVQARFSGIPQVIYPDQTVTLGFSFAPTEDSVKHLSFTASAGADFDQWNLEPGGRTAQSVSFTNLEEESSFMIISGQGQSYNTKLTAKLGQGSENSRIALRLKMSLGVPMGTNYIYEWKQVGSGSSVSPDEIITEPKKKQCKPIREDIEFWKKWSEQAKKWTEEDIEEAKKTSNGVRIGDLHGECHVLRGWEEDIDQAIYIEPDTPIYHGDLIMTTARSGVILSFSDLSTYSIGENTNIILDHKVAGPESKLELIGGIIWGNLKRMAIDGSLEVEGSQAVAGIKGTTFVCEEYEDVSTLKVIEGTVSYISKSTGAEILVTAGEMIDVDENGFWPVINFDVTKEEQLWESTYQYLSEKAE